MIEIRVPKNKLMPTRAFAIGNDGSEIEITGLISYEEDNALIPHYYGGGPIISKSASVKIECYDYKIVSK